MSAPPDLRKRRLAAGLTQRQLSECTGIPQPNISDYERGRRTPSSETADRIVAATRRRPHELLSEHREEARAVVRRHHGAEAWVIGSVARGDDEPDSDLDVLIRFDGSAHGYARVVTTLPSRRSSRSCSGVPSTCSITGG